MTAVIPAPLHQEPASCGSFTLRPGDGISFCDEALASLARTFCHDLHADTGLQLVPTAAEPSAVHLELADAVDELRDLPATHGISPTDGDPAAERYALDIGPEGVRIRATAPEGLFRGLTTLRQVIATTARPHDVAVTLSALRVLDAPRFAWRGLSLDVARTFFNVAEVKAVIDLLAQYKLNVLHLHLTDDQGWRLHIDAWPALTEVSGHSAFGERPGGFYTKEEYQDLVRYAADRFVTVVPEIDLPGHCKAVFSAYPELAPASFDPQDNGGLSIAVLDPNLATTMPFVTDVLSEVAALTPGPYLHIGGDEAFGMADGPYELFVTQVRLIVAHLGKKPVGWQETARSGLAAGDIVQYWLDGLDYFDLDVIAEGMALPDEMRALIETSGHRAAQDARTALEAGARLLLSPLTLTYLNQPYAEKGDPAQEAERDRLGLKLYPGTTVESTVNWDPATAVDGITSEDQIAGIEAAIWCESVTGFSDLQFLLLPRLTGTAERAWAPQTAYENQDYTERLAAQAPTWRRAGWNYFRAESIPWQ